MPGVIFSSIVMLLIPLISKLAAGVVVLNQQDGFRGEKVSRIVPGETRTFDALG
jgi:hypothetical protein